MNTVTITEKERIVYDEFVKCIKQSDHENCFTEREYENGDHEHSAVDLKMLRKVGIFGKVYSGILSSLHSKGLIHTSEDTVNGNTFIRQIEVFSLDTREQIFSE